MELDGSVTRWIGRLKNGDDDAARLLWERYFARLARLTRARLRASRAAGPRDEEDLALSVLNAVCAGAARGQFPQLAGREDLWRLLVVISVRKVLNEARDGRRLKRGGGLVQTEADLAGADWDDAGVLARVVGDEPTPEFAAIVAEEFDRRLASLPDDASRQVARLRLEGYDNDEIARRLGCTSRTVVRKVGLIRRYWLDAGP